MLEVTEKYLSDNLSKNLQEKVKVLKLESLTNSSGYLSNTKTAQVAVGDEQRVESLFVKESTDDAEMGQLVTGQGLDITELHFYSDIYKRLVQFEKDVAGNSELEQYIPKCFHGEYKEMKEGGRSFVLILEDLRAIGFKLLNFNAGLPVEDMKSFVKSVAVLHSVSYAYSFVKSVKWMTEHPVLNCLPQHILTPAWTKHLEYTLENYIRLDDPEKSKRLNEFVKAIQVDMSEQVANDKHKCLIHDDLWSNNVLWNSEHECKVIDFQCLTAGDPIVDLSLVLLFNMEPAVLKKECEGLLQIYYKTFNDNIKRLSGNEGIPCYWKSFDSLKQNHESEEITMSDITETWLEQVMKSKLNEEVQVLSLKRSETSGGFVSNSFTAKVQTCRTQDIISLFIKVSPTDPEMAKMLFEQKMDMVEHSFYDRVSKEIIQFEKKVTGTSEFEKLVPKCYFTSCSENQNGTRNSVFVLEDLRTNGYQLLDFSLSMPLENVKALVKGMAVLHGTTYAYSHVKNVKWSDAFPEAHDFAKYSHDPFMNHMIESTLETHLKFDDPTKNEILAKFASRRQKEMEKVLANDQFSCLLHNDLWSNNLMWNAEGECKMVDFQMATFGDPIVDLGWALLFNMDHGELEPNINSLLLLYYNAFNNAVSKLDVNKSVPDCWHSFQTLKERFETEGYLSALRNGIYCGILIDPYPSFGKRVIDVFEKCYERRYL